MRRSWLVGLAWLVGVLAVRDCDCDGTRKDDPHFECIDNDGDGYGEDCQLGVDCDDSDPNLNVSCDCAVLPYEGCPCVAGDEIACFEAPDQLKDVGNCKAGRRLCESEKYTACIGQTLPEDERCDKNDNDCDSLTDEGLNCEDCGARCFGVGIGPGNPQGFDLNDDNGRGVELDPDGNLKLKDGGEQIELTFLYVANSDEGTVSKVNTKTGREEGRYLSALYTQGDPRNRGTASSGGNAPSRTAVDFNGDVWVANRAFGLQGTVTKIANQGCLDFDGDSIVETSTDANGDGVISLGDPAEFLGEADECILFTVNAGEYGAVPRALALDSGGGAVLAGNAWVGLYNEQKFLRLDAQDGHVIAEVAVGLHPYGAAIDSQGILWSTQEATARLVSIDTSTLTAGPVVTIANGCMGSYGIAIDYRNRVWVGGYGGEGACSYDPSDGSSRSVPTLGIGVGRGIAADATGYIWLAHSWTESGTSIGRVTRFKADDGSEMRSYDFPADSIETIGVGIDFDGFVWGVNRAGDNACRVEPASGAVQCFPVGNGPYTYSDFTGYALRNFTAPLGTYTTLFQGCGGVETRWKQLTWEATVPDGTEVKLYVKAADTEAGLQGAVRYGPFVTSPADLIAAGTIVGNLLRVEVVLSTAVDKVTPIFKALAVQWICGGET